MEKSFVRQTRSKTRAAKQINLSVDEDPCTANRNPDPADDGFTPSMTDFEHGENRDCAVCNRPNNADLYMVQCGRCKRWNHFSCARVDTQTVHSKEYCCVECTSKIEPDRPTRSVSSRSSAASGRRSNIDREIQRLEDERRVEEQIEQERLRQEKFLIEKTAKEKLEREKQFIAKKHALLRQQDDDIESIVSRRSSRSSIHKVQNWVQQSINPPGVVDSSEKDYVPKPARLQPIPVGSSTPLECGEISVDEPQLSVAGVRDSGRRMTGGTSIGKSPAIEYSKLPLVNIQPYTQFLEELEPTPSHPVSIRRTGTKPKTDAKAANPTPFDMWKRETCGRRKEHQDDDERKRYEHRLSEIEISLQRQHDMEIKRHQENEERRMREIELVDRLNRLEEQHAEERQHLEEVANALKKRLEESQLRYQALEKKQKHDQAAREEELRRLQEREQLLTMQLNSVHIEHRSKGLPLQDAEENEPREAAQVHPQESLAEWGRCISNPFPVSVSGTRFNRYEEDSCSVQCSVREAPGTSAISPLDRAETPRTFTINRGLSPTHVGQQSQTPFNPYHPPELNSFVSNNLMQDQLGPTRQQIVARQVIPKELPIFSGDPTEWPLFISSYQQSTISCGYSDSENLWRLQRALKGIAKESVSSFLLHPSTVPQIISMLQTLYGRPEQIVHHLVAKVRATPAPRADKLETLIQFGLVVQNLCGHLKAIGMHSHLSNPILLQELVDKLPSNIKFSWALYQEQQPVVNLSTFGDYMERVTAATSGITNVCPTTKHSKDDRPRAKEKAYVNTHTAYEKKKPGPPNSFLKRENRSEQLWDTNCSGNDETKDCSKCKSREHVAEECAEFKKLSVNERWKFVKENKLCRRCLIAHTRWPCEGEICEINGCQKRHHRLLHYDPDPEKSLGTTNATIAVHQQFVTSTLFKILPIKLHGKNGSVDTYAFLDDGSSATLLEKSIADELGVDGKSLSLCMQWTSGIDKKVTTTQIARLGISEPGSEAVLQLSEVYTVENLGLPEQSIDYDELAKQYKHLQRLPVKSFQRVRPGLLIGVNNIHLLTTSKVREGKEQEPIAAKTRIGWVVCGCLRGEENQLQHRQMHICADASELDLHNYVREFFSVESIGVAIAPNLEGTDDQRARRILEETTVRKTNGKYETGLLWKHDDFVFPDSRPMAERRLKCLERRLAKNPQLYDSVRQQITDYESKGYIHVVTEEEEAEFDSRRTWYLPLGVVLNPNKPGKVRVIWDAAAKVNGVSLNTLLLKGPDLLTPQLTVTFKFREREVAFSGDIQEMFLQVGIRKRDRSALLFVFRNSPSQPMVTMASDVAIFGATCSPAQSQYVKNLNAAEHEQEFPRAAAAIRNRHYVDDYLDSVDTEKEAIELALEVASVHQKAGFHIRNWVSNRSKVLESIGEINPATVKNLTMNNQSGFERLLGISWLPDEDVFCFKLSLQGDLEELAEGEKPPTKRMMLSFLMRIYDPLGLVGSLVIQGKILLQDVWRAQVDWDQQIPEDIFRRWKSWLQVLHALENVRIQRCYFPGYDPTCYDSLELHIFVDGSTQAYSAVSYFRVLDRGQIRCSLVASKTKVAPLQLLSTPRIELQGAVIGARLRKTIEEGHSVKIKRTIFWSDSSTVISWIRSDTRRYRQYVAFRVNEILNLSSVEEWRWLGTKFNVADEATKWGKGPNCEPGSRWMRGPDFLYEDESNWPKYKLDHSTETSEELRSAYVYSHFMIVPEVNVDRFSKYERLLRSIAYVFHFCDILLRRSRGEHCDHPGILTGNDLQKAERSLWRIAQAEHYSDEIATLKHNLEADPQKRQSLGKGSSIAKLSPQLDEHGILRFESRIAAAEYVSYDTRCPIILPRRHQITKLLLDWYHRAYRHANNETIVNEVRQKFNIAKLRMEVRSAARRCQWCRIYKAKPVTPKMGQLPKVRVTPFLRPFTFVGIDYFGPYYVKVGRSSVKRWVAIFTCLTVRAIHMELAYSLTTESCKKAIRRFIARRGAPQEIYSDNGTNFVGASRELQSELRTLNTTMSSTFTDANTKWRFNPPAAPHMGGCWERMVRSVKTALGSLPTARKLDDEGFMTLLAEAEHMVNSRPLTFVPLDNVEHESLTPNHFLMLSSNGVRQGVKVPVDTKRVLSDGWTLLQQMLDIFWQRWIVEYLPVISRRSKWFQDVAPVNKGMLVVIIDEKNRNEWLRGRVIRTYPGKDGVVRKADVETPSGILSRSVNKLAVLDVLQNGDADKDLGRHGGENVTGKPPSE